MLIENAGLQNTQSVSVTGALNVTKSTFDCEPTTTSTFNAQMKIARLKFSSPFDGKTSKGIGIGSTKAAVKAAYGDPSSSSPSSGDSYTIGVIFIYDAGDLVKSIEVK